MTTFSRILLALLFTAGVSSSELFAQKGGRGKGRQGNGGSTAQSMGGRQGNAQTGRGQGQQSRQGQMGNGQNAQSGQRGGRGQGRQSGGTLDAAARQELALMREEEKLARDVYAAMKEKWGATIFANIARAESRHMQVLGGLLTRYKIQDPIVNNAPGAFTNPKFQQLYNSLVASGSASLIDALKVGLKIEEMDIADLRNAMRSTNNADIQRVYQHLEQGSQNHLRAFAMQLKKQGGTYVPTSLHQADFDMIANSPRGQNGNQAQGKGGGQGRGKRGQQGRAGNSGGQNVGGNAGGNAGGSNRGNAGNRKGQGKGKGRGK